MLHIHGANRAQVIDVYPVDASGKLYDVRPSESSKNAQSDLVHLSRDAHVEPASRSEPLTYQHLKTKPKPHLNNSDMRDQPLAFRIPSANQPSLSARAEATYRNIAEQRSTDSINFYI